MRLMAIILTYNEADNIGPCLEALAFADERLVMDSFSSDATVALAQAQGARVVQRAFEDYATQRNAALQEAQGLADWVLFIDADERVSPTLAAEISGVLADERYVAWQVPRHNYIFGRLTLSAGWYPDHQTRLLRVGRAHYDPNRWVHEVVVLDGERGTLQNPLTHYNYRDLAHFRAKQRRYAAYDAQILFEQSFRPRPHNYLLQPLRQFKWRFITLKGYQEGWHGFLLSALMAWYEWRKFRLLGHLWRTERR